MSLIQKYRHKMPWPARSYMFFLTGCVVYEAAEKRSAYIDVCPRCRIVVRFVSDGSLVDDEDVVPDDKQVVLAHMELLLRLSPSKN